VKRYKHRLKKKKKTARKYRGLDQQGAGQVGWGNRDNGGAQMLGLGSRPGSEG